METKLILHNYRRCPFCIRVRILFYLQGIAYEIVEEPLREWTPWMREWSTKAGEKPRVPVLREITDGDQAVVHTESVAIMELFDTRHGAAYTPDSDTDSHHEMRRWFSWCDTTFKQQIDLFKYGKDLQFDAAAHIGHVAGLREMVLELETTLQNQSFLVGNSMTLADIAVIPFVRQIMRTRNGEFDFTDFPRVLAWVNGVLESDWFEKVVMRK